MNHATFVVYIVAVSFLATLFPFITASLHVPLLEQRVDLVTLAHGATMNHHGAFAAYACARHVELHCCCCCVGLTAPTERSYKAWGWLPALHGLPLLCVYVYHTCTDATKRAAKRCCCWRRPPFLLSTAYTQLVLYSATWHLHQTTARKHHQQ